jgi:hypothetical protein
MLLKVLEEPAVNPILTIKSPVYVADPNVILLEVGVELATTTDATPSAPDPGLPVPPYPLSASTQDEEVEPSIFTSNNISDSLIFCVIPLELLIFNVKLSHYEVV